jgi:hypothetical protein
MGEEKDGTGRVRQVIAVTFAAALVCVFSQGETRAQPMNDPMRPADAPSAGAATGAGGPALQVVITSPQRKLAVIDGAVVPVGAPVKGATLDAVSDSVAVLRKDGERNVLLMHPDVDKKPARRERR